MEMKMEDVIGKSEPKQSNAVTYLVVGLVVLVLVFAVAQTFQINSLEQRAVQGTVLGAATGNGASSPQPAASRSAPQMVGGC